MVETDGGMDTRREMGLQRTDCMRNFELSSVAAKRIHIEWTGFYLFLDVQKTTLILLRSASHVLTAVVQVLTVVTGDDETAPRVLTLIKWNTL